MTQRHGRRRPRAFSIDFLENRTLLNAARPSSPTAEVRTDAAASSIHVTLKGSDLYSSSYEVGNGTVFIYDISANGHVAKLGRIHLQASSMSVVVGREVFISQGKGTLSDSHGDQESLTFSGTELYHSPKKPSFSLSGTVTGGSGRFANATGSLSATGTAPSAKTIQLSLTVPI